jgi:hypothetical protein
MPRGGKRSTSFKPASRAILAADRNTLFQNGCKRHHVAASGFAWTSRHQARAPFASAALSQRVKKPPRARWAMACLRPRRDILVWLRTERLPVFCLFLMTLRTARRER